MKRKMENFLYRLLHNSIIDWNGCFGKMYLNARKDFIPPKIKMYFFRKDSDFYLTDLCYQDYAFITIDDMDWKTKFGDYRFEWLPYICIKLFKWRLIFTLEAPDGDNLRYYELILNYLYRHNKNYKETLENYSWSRLIDGKWIKQNNDNYGRSKC